MTYELIFRAFARKRHARILKLRVEEEYLKTKHCLEAFTTPFSTISRKKMFLDLEVFESRYTF